MKLNSARGLTLLFALFLAENSIQQESLLEKIADTNFKNSFCKFFSLNVQDQDKKCEIGNNQYLKKNLVTCETTKECKEIFKKIVKNFSFHEDQAVKNFINKLERKQSNNRKIYLGSTPITVTDRSSNGGSITRNKPFRWGK